MTKELVISATRHETKVALLEDDQLVEIYFQHANEYSLAGSIHKGRVTRVLPGMQSAFVDLGLERDTFLYVSDFFEENEEYDSIGPAEDRPQRGRERGDRDRDRDRERDFTKVDVPRALPPGIEREREVFAPPPVVAPPVEVSPVEAVDAPPVAGRPDDQGQNRGRRSRRRRTKARGFPDSKYASEVDRSSPEEPEFAAPAAEVKDIILLPGESLAKYTRPSGNAVEEDDLEAVEAAVADMDEPDPVQEPEPEPVTPEEPEPIREPEPEPPPVTEPDVEEPPIRTQEAKQEATQEEQPPVFGSGFPETAFFVPEMHQSVAETEESDEEELETGEPLESDGELEAAEPVEPAAANPDQPVSAEVRDQSSRYQHRVPRRSRRRGRGERPQGDRPPGDRPERPERTETRVEPEVRAEVVEPEQRPRTERPPRPEREEKPQPSITDLLREGQEIIVQIAKEPLGQKGARITSHIALPGRYVVYMPTLEHLGVSRKIESDDERLRLKKILQTHRAGITGGYIVRTAGEGHTEEEIAADMAFLYNLWLDIRQKAEKKKAPALLHHDLEIVQRVLRDQLTEAFKAVWVDNEEVYESVLRFMQRFQPALVSRIKLYTRPQPIFDTFGITAEIEKGLRPKVWLKSGGYIVINQTEALVAIDVNTGKYVGKSNRLEDTITKTNTEAVKEIVRQIRLRDLGGIIVVDFIDMDERKNRQKVMQTLEDAMRVDRAPYKILQFNDFGLVAITRKRVKQSLERSLCSPCPVCEGSGYVKSVTTVVGEILQEALKLSGALEGKNVVLRAHPEVAKFLKASTNKHLEELEEVLGKPVLVTGDPSLHPEKFDLG